MPSYTNRRRYIILENALTLREGARPRHLGGGGRVVLFPRLFVAIPGAARGLRAEVDRRAGPSRLINADGVPRNHLPPRTVVRPGRAREPNAWGLPAPFACRGQRWQQQTIFRRSRPTFRS